jgi:hypothetical protein
LLENGVIAEKKAQTDAVMQTVMLQYISVKISSKYGEELSTNRKQKLMTWLNLMCSIQKQRVFVTEPKKLITYRRMSALYKKQLKAQMKTGMF